ncbi:MAG TPA: hypothetical protein PKB03_00085 [Baekduia sp.]|nr:hypothetical protein [Baekduia sp.]
MSEAAAYGRLSKESQRLPRLVVERINAHPDSDLYAKIIAKQIAGHLNGLRVDELESVELAQLAEYGQFTDAALQLLGDVGYGPDLYRQHKPRQEREHGALRERRLEGVVGKLPRALALRMPTSADTHRRGPIKGRDRWGPVESSQTLRPAHLGLVAALCGLWGQRSSPDQPYVGCTAGELTQLLSGRTRHGGRDVETIHRLLADLEQLQLTADGADLDSQHRIPSSPIALVERRIGDRWVAADQYADALLEDSTVSGAQGQVQVSADEIFDGPATIRVHLAPWVRKELSHAKRRPVYIDLDVWAHLRPQSSRLYAFLQGSPRDGYDGGIYFYLAEPTCFTLGLRGRRDRCAQSVSADLSAIVKADRRYERFRRHTHSNTQFPAFGVTAKERKSEATELAKINKCEPKRSRQARQLESLRRQAQRRGADGSTPLRDFRKIAAAVSRDPKPPSRPRRPALRRQLYPDPAPAAAAA